jgi:putative acetyltransferase
MMRLRPAHSEELGALRELQDVSFSALATCYDEALRVAHSAAMAEEAWLEDLRRSDIWVAEEAGVVLGTAGWIAQDEGVARIRKVFVHPAATRRGIATALVRAAEERSAAARFVLRANLNAVPLYERLGYLPDRTGSMALPGGLSMPVLFMRKG